MTGDDFSTNLHVVVDDGYLNRLLYDELSDLGLNAHLLPASSDLNSLNALIQKERAGGELASIHLYAHGEPGKLPLSRTTQEQQPSAGPADGWTAIGQQLRPGGDLLLYGCEVAKEPSGRALMDRLARLTQRDVAASTDLTGADGDWDLEYQTGTIETSITDVLTGINWAGSLATKLNDPVKVPLHWVKLSSEQDSERKLGLYATIGGSQTPQLFEFDTGGEGFYAAYGDASTAPWWGPNWSTTGQAFDVSYDSGLTYTGEAVRSDVELFADPEAREPRLSAKQITLGQSSSITNAKEDKGTLWPLPDAGSQPPVNGVFYGDFGLAPRAGVDQINSLTHQLRYGKGLVAGFRVHASEKKPWVQFGLTRRDLKSTKTTFRLETDQPGSVSSTGVPFYNFNVTSGVMEISVGRGRDRSDFRRERTGIILDTGAQTTIHQSSEDVIPSSLTVAGSDRQILPGALVMAQGKSESRRSSGEWATILRGRAGAEGASRVMIQDTGKTYLNTGIRPFLTHDVIYNLADARLTLIPRSKASRT